MEKWGVNWKKPVTIAILAFIAVLFFAFSKTADAAETTAELAPGTMFVAGHHYTGGTLILSERWRDKYELGLGLTTEWGCTSSCGRGEGPSNQFVYAMRVAVLKQFQIGIGISYWHNQTPAWNSNTPFTLMVGWQVDERWSVKLRHFSTGGTSTNNGGLDLLTAGYTF